MIHWLTRPHLFFDDENFFGHSTFHRKTGSSVVTAK